MKTFTDACLPAPVGRLAPSPTGALHLGNARTFLLTWLSIRQQAGTLILRIEDIDSARVKPGAVQSVIQDLKWLGLDWDFGPSREPVLRNGVPCFQSQRLPRYRQVLQTLIDDQKVYPCSCSRSQIAQQSASAPHEPAWTQLEGPVYAGTCRKAYFESGRLLQLHDENRAALRWAFDPGQVSWSDGLHGLQSACPLLQLGDFVIGRGNGQPSYQLAVVVDDYDMAVTEIVRGDDLMLSTYRQQAILRHLQWPAPKYYHVPLMHAAGGQRLAKRQGDSITFLRERGISPEAVVGYLAYTAGLTDRPHPMPARELIGSLDWQKLSLTAFTLSEDWTAQPGS